MLQRAALLQLLLFATYFTSFAQPKPTDFQPLKSTGEIPKDMIIKSSKKYEVEKSTISKTDKKKDRKTQESFYLSTHFEIDKLLLSGMVSFNDPITVYLNKIVDVLLKDEPALRKIVRVYTMKSTDVNAFATNQGIIFINLGLLAKVKSEAELAFILSHEIIHVEKKHSLNKYLKVQTIERDKDLYKNLSLDDKLATVNHYSRELETEADEHGLTRYLKAGYSLDAIKGAFTVLEYAHRPCSEDEFDHKWLESNTFLFPEEFYRTKLNTVKALEEDEDEELDEDGNPIASTHPSVDKRQAHIQGKLKDISPEGRKTSQVSETDFLAAREFAQFEVCRLHLLRQRYDLAIYEAQALLKQYPDNVYLQKLKLKAMAAMAFFAHDGISIGEWEDYVNEELQGNVQRAYHFFLSLAVDADYIATVATRYSWQLKQQYPQDKEIAAIADSMMRLLFYEREVEPEFFSMTPRTQTEIDSILQEYEFVKNPKKREEILALAKGGDSTAIDKVIDTNNVSVRTTLINNPKNDDDDISIFVEEDVEEEEDTIMATTPAEAKKMGIKLTGYEKYQLKHKDRYGLKGVRRDGTFVYETSTRHSAPTDGADEETIRGGQQEEANRNEDNEQTSEDDTTVVLGSDSTTVTNDTLAIVEEEIYHHDFKNPIDKDFHKYAFVDFAGDESFLKTANSLHKKRKTDDDFVLSKTQKKHKQRENELNYTRGFALNIKKVVIVNPRYSKINLVNTDKQQYLTSEKNQKRFSNILQSSAKASGIQYQLIDNRDLKNKEVATFNDIAFLNEWLNERLELGSDVPLSSMELADREALVKKYGTRYFMWTGNLSVKERAYSRASGITYSVLFPPLLPFLLPKLIRDGKYQIYYYLVFDIMTNEMVLGDVIYSNQLERNDFLNSQSYYTFNQLKIKR